MVERIVLLFMHVACVQEFMSVAELIDVLGLESC
jgi:hypothetical protein